MNGQRGFFAIGIVNPKIKINIGTLWRSAGIFGAAYIFTIGDKYKHQGSDTVKAWRHLPMFHYNDFNDFNEHRPKDADLVGIEINEKSRVLTSFIHPERVIYLLGSEVIGLPQEILDKCDNIVKIPGEHCLNMAVAGSIVLYDRLSKNESKI